VRADEKLTGFMELESAIPRWQRVLLTRRQDVFKTERRQLTAMTSPDEKSLKSQNDKT
jgi:hypothetical protein